MSRPRMTTLSEVVEGLPEYLFLVRHGRKADEWRIADRAKGLELDRSLRPLPRGDQPATGLEEVRDMAGYLCDWLESRERAGRKIAVRRVFSSQHRVAIETAIIFGKVLGLRGSETIERQELAALEPEHSRPAGWCKGDWGSLREMAADGEGSAALLVGHQPALGELARYLAGGKLPGGTLPIGRAEVACLKKHGKRFRLQWLLTNAKDALLERLRSKIQSKFDVAKFFLGAFIVNNAILLNETVWAGANPVQQKILAAAVLAALASLLLTVWTLFSYDELLMPARFWGGVTTARGWQRNKGEEKEGARKTAPRWSVERPPSQAHLVLFYEMIHAWKAFFVPALIAAFVSVLGVLFVIADKSLKLTESPGGWIGSSVILAVLVGAGWLFYRYQKPQLGFED